jgi:NTE family protein
VSVLDWFRRDKVAFVLSGGGNLGATQVGMLRALTERGIRADLVLGASVGALNGAAYAADPTPQGVRRLEDLWVGLEDEDVMPGSWMPRSLQLARKGESIHSNEGLKKVIDSVLTAETFGELQVPFQCVTTAVEPAEETWFHRGPLKAPILASAALPAVYPLVEIDGIRYMDGAVVNDVPVARAVELGARTIYVLHVGTLDRPWLDPKRPFDVIVQAYWIARRHRYKEDLAALPRRVKAIILPVGSPPPLKYNDFTRSEELIAQSYGATAAHLDAITVRRSEVPPPAPPLRVVGEEDVGQ